MAVGAVRSCGVSTAALALAATWPAGRRVLLVEADPAGGTLAAASGWPAEPGLVSLAAASRRSFNPAVVWEHCQALPGGAAVLAGPASAERARGALGMLGDLAGHLPSLDADVVVDCGRLDSGSPAIAVWEGADRQVLVVRPRLADLHAVAAWTETHATGREPSDVRPERRARVGLVVVGEGPYPDAEIAEALDVEVLCRLPWDPRGAAALVSVPASSREARLAPLVRAARSLADGLADDLAACAGQPDAQPDADRAPEHVTASRLAARVLRGWRPESAATVANGATPGDGSG